MKKIYLILIIAVMAIYSPENASSWDLKDLLNSANGSNSTSTSQGNDSTKKSGGLGDLLSGVANALGAGTKELTVESLAGTWKYVSPAVTFKSDNLLMKAGGAAAASQVESKLEPYYKAAGFNTLVLTINNDSTFNFKARMANLNGTIEKDAETGNFLFKFKAIKKINVGSMETFIVMNGDKMDLTFDVSKLMTLIEKVGAITNNSSIKTVSSILNQYDGVTAGFSLQR